MFHAKPDQLFSQTTCKSLNHIVNDAEDDVDYLLPFQIATLITQPFSKLSEVSLDIRQFNTWIPVISAFSKIQNLKFLHLSIHDNKDIKLIEIYFLCDVLKSYRSLYSTVSFETESHRSSNTVTTISNSCTTFTDTITFPDAFRYAP